ncbi:hypothetical protein [Embleya hyalina]|uniref:Uncharacterized protein n=1 Tax=Embleya hyalina TaxID=516124 RepID=A0A401YIK9_9ACTN|nr:hypothetical protein [Embleya hyalina]GCD94454.1 hypothetical protein EHYA_02122 [Embleya hyalina]
MPIPLLPRLPVPLLPGRPIPRLPVPGLLPGLPRLPLLPGVPISGLPLLPPVPVAVSPAVLRWVTLAGRRGLLPVRVVGSIASHTPDGTGTTPPSVVAGRW